MTSKRKELMEAVPRRELHLFDEMDRLFDALFHRGWLRPFRESWPEWAGLGETFEMTAPRVDLIDREDELLVRAEVPGVEKKDLEVDLSGQMLTIRGERRREEKKGEGEYFRSEIARGSFSRTLRLPEEVDFEKARAEFADGMLEIHLPKTHKTERRRITVA
ncbi:MAG: Hsp20/alpha crystallin family protein [Chromatiaceae bacterium]|jgi:HSP20 family protein|nr:Hsp20/alpha crystallin family protein [Chromatiaceae bacterium]